MSFTKSDIIKNVKEKSNLSTIESINLVNSFFLIVKNESILKDIKLSGFGSFRLFKTKKRLGRNPQTKKEYIIPVKLKHKFIPSNKLKKHINY